MPGQLKAETVVNYYDQLVARNWTPEKEKQFQDWYAKYAEEYDLDPDPDNELHYYNWRAAYMVGAKPDKSGHWPSMLKTLGHPDRFINGIDTIIGQ